MSATGDGAWSLHLGDCIDWMRVLPDKAWDHHIGDPPYSPHVHACGMRGAAGSRKAERKFERAEKRLQQLQRKLSEADDKLAAATRERESLRQELCATRALQQAQLEELKWVRSELNLVKVMQEPNLNDARQRTAAARELVADLARSLTREHSHFPPEPTACAICELLERAQYLLDR